MVPPPATEFMTAAMKPDARTSHSAVVGTG
jgi:hypothetical protein